MDLHTQGFYCVIDKDGKPIADTAASTGYSARAEFCNSHNQRWSKAYEQGYRIARWVLAEVYIEPIAH